jgi:CheY-like chemotaxis protein/HPt (histidine-containing phosphotransfer) domain-containing protein
MLRTASDKEIPKAESEALHVTQRLIKPVKIRELSNALSQIHLPVQVAGAVKFSPKPAANAGEFKILVVEDNPVNMLLTQTIVKRILPNAILLQATNGREAVDLCQHTWPDLILMDMQMPEMNGLEATRNIRLMDKGPLPIVALTAGTLKEERDKCLAGGMDDFMVKPLMENVLRATLSRWLGYQTIDEKSDFHNAENAVQHFNPEQMLKYAGNDPEIVSEVIVLTKAELSDSLQKLAMHIEQHDLPSIKSVGHHLYGTAATAGLAEIAKMALQLENSDKFDPDLMRDVYATLAGEITHVMTLLDKESSK